MSHPEPFGCKDTNLSVELQWREWNRQAKPIALYKNFRKTHRRGRNGNYSATLQRTEVLTSWFITCIPSLLNPCCRKSSFLKKVVTHSKVQEQFCKNRKQDATWNQAASILHLPLSQPMRTVIGTQMEGQKNAESRNTKKAHGGTSAFNTSSCIQPHFLSTAPNSLHFGWFPHQ